MTRHEKIGLMCTKIHTITLFHISQFYVRYTSSANFIKFSIVCYSTCKSFIDNYFWARSYEVSKSKKVIKFYVYISPIFSCRFTYIVYHIDACTIFVVKAYWNAISTFVAHPSFNLNRAYLANCWLQQLKL